MLALTVTLSVLLAFFVLVHTEGEIEHPRDNGWDGAALEKAVWATNYMELPNDTYVYFYFTNAGSWGTPQFQTTVPLGGHLDLYWWDLYCAGDQMTFYTMLDYGGGGTFNFTLPSTTPVGVASCVNYTTDPAVADVNPAFSKGAFHTPGGFVANYTIVTTLSPFSAGRGIMKAIYHT